MIFYLKYALTGFYLGKFNRNLAEKISLACCSPWGWVGHGLATEQPKKDIIKKLSWSCRKICWPSVEAQWLRIHLPVQGTHIWSLILDDLTCWGNSTLNPLSIAHALQWGQPPCERLLPRTRKQPLLATARDPQAAVKTQHSQKSLNTRKKIYWTHLLFSFYKL